MLTYNHPEAVSRFLKGVDFSPDIDGLARLTTAFLRFPYENFSKIIRYNTVKDEVSRLRLPDTIVRENEESGLGGTCFSLTYFFETVLKETGFECYSVMVDRSYGKNTHCAMIVTLDGQKYLVDPGFCLSRPIPLTDKETEYNLPHNTYIVQSAPPPIPSPLRGEREGGGYTISTKQLGRTKPRYFLKDSPVSSADFLKHWQESFSWPMMRQICVTKLGEDGYTYLRNDFLRNVTSDGKKQERIKNLFGKNVESRFGISAKKAEEAKGLIAGPQG